MEDLMTMDDTASATIVATAKEKAPETPSTFSKPAITAPASPASGADQQQRQHPKPGALQRTQSLSVKISKLQIPHTRAASVATSSPARNRLSLSFPVLPQGYNSTARNYPPATSSGTTTPPNGYEVPQGDSTSFLTALAGQERRVLELKEELSKAESELAKLKRQWATHEANKSRYELALNSGLTSPLRSGDARNALTSPTNREEFQRQQRAVGSGGRKVLPSQRHQRTLSLLSQDRGDFRQPFPRPKDVDSDLVSARGTAKRHSLMSPPSMREASSIMTTRTQSLDLQERPKNQDVLLKTGQQIAADFRDGLWTFLEDLKQATVGDDTPRAPPITANRPGTVRRVSSKANLRSGSVEKANGAALQRALPRDKPRKGKEPETEESLIDFGQDDNEQRTSFRDDRDPSFRWSSSTTSDYLDPNGIMTPPSRASTPRTSTSSITSPYNPDSTPQTPIWSTLTSTTAFTQSQLKKHANALMSQVEKSFAIPSETSSSSLSRSNSTGCQRFGGTVVGGIRSRAPQSPIKTDSSVRDA